MIQMFPCFPRATRVHFRFLSWLRKGRKMTEIIIGEWETCKDLQGESHFPLYPLLHYLLLLFPGKPLAFSCFLLYLPTSSQPPVLQFPSLLPCP